MRKTRPFQGTSLPPRLRDGGFASWLTRCITQPCMQGGELVPCLARDITSASLARRKIRILVNQMHYSTLHATRRTRPLPRKGHYFHFRLACETEDPHPGLPDVLPPYTIHHAPRKRALLSPPTSKINVSQNDKMEALDKTFAFYVLTFTTQADRFHKRISTSRAR